jgi:CheY-like chemotaxis protein
MTAQILVVDDEPDIEALVLQRFRHQIRDGAVSFVFARDGVEALAALKTNGGIDLVVTDIIMPRMDGLSLLQKLQDSEEKVSTIIVSAYGDMANIRTAMNRGAFDFVTKPINFLDLEATFLSRAECHLLTASTGLEAIRVARAEKPDLIVLDIEMPEMNGIQACRILKSEAVTSHIPVIVLTSMQMEDEARRAGANHFLRKPIDEPTFLAEVKRFLPIVERTETRVSLDAPVTLWRDGETFEVRLVNLSRTGFYVEASQRHPIGARLEVSFSLPEDPSGKLITGEALVVRLGDDPPGFGCRFRQVSMGARLVVEDWVERVAAGR